MSGKSDILFITDDGLHIKEITEDERLLRRIKIHFAKSGTQAIDILSFMPEIPVFIIHALPDINGVDISRSLSEQFPGILTIIITDHQPDIDQEHDNCESSLIMPLPETQEDYAMVIRQGIRTHNYIKRKTQECKSMSEEKDSMEETTHTIMGLYQDLANLVHCGQSLQETVDRDGCCQIITEALKDMGLDCSIEFKDDEGDKKEIRQLTEEAGKHFEITDKSARIYFANSKYAGLIDVQSSNGGPFDEDRLSDPLHLIRNQFISFLDRFGRIEEKEQLLEGYKAILDKLEEIIKNADVSGKTQKIRKDLENDTESIFNILDKIREKVPEDVVPWVNEIELSLQFADKVSQQVNSLASILRDLLGTINPSMSDELRSESNESTKSVFSEEEDEGKRKSVDELLESLGV